MLLLYIYIAFPFQHYKSGFNFGETVHVSCLALKTTYPYALLLKLLPIATGSQLTDNIKPERDVRWLHRDHPNDFRHFITFHDGEVVKGFIKSQRHWRGRRLFYPLDVEACSWRFLGPAIVHCLYLVGVKKTGPRLSIPAWQFRPNSITRRHLLGKWPFNFLCKIPGRRKKKRDLSIYFTVIRFFHYTLTLHWKDWSKSEIFWLRTDGVRAPGDVHHTQIPVSRAGFPLWWHLPASSVLQQRWQSLCFKPCT